MTGSEVLRALATELRADPFYRDSAGRLQSEITADRLAELCERAAERIASDEWMERLGDDL